MAANLFFWSTHVIPPFCCTSKQSFVFSVKYSHSLLIDLYRTAEHDQFTINIVDAVRSVLPVPLLLTR